MTDANYDPIRATVDENLRHLTNAVTRKAGTMTEELRTKAAMHDLSLTGLLNTQREEYEATIAALKAENERLREEAARATAEKTGLLEAIKHHSGHDHGIMGIRSLVDRAAALDALMAENERLLAAHLSVTELWGESIERREAAEARAEAAEARIAELEADHLEERLAMSGRIEFLEDVSAVPHLEQRISELEKRLADAERVIEPFVDGRAKTTHANGCRYHGGHDCDCGKDDYLRAARSYMEGK